MSKNNCFSSSVPCSGCGACYSVCPAGAVGLECNSDGFFEARVNAEKCISCGKCAAVCPKALTNEKQLNVKTFSVYSFIHKDPRILAESSSGAAGWALIEEGLAQGYRVVGVTYDNLTHTAKAQVAQDLQQARAFKGSKYLQADTAVYKDLLKSDGKFIVFGTPCQLAGLSKVLEQAKRRDDFLLVDCFCHGVPSYLLWHKFLEHIGCADARRVSFRSKKGGWHNFYMEIDGTKKHYAADARTNPFYRLFFSDLLLGDACYSCRAKSAAFADIRLGDFWGADYDLTDQGVSLMLPLSVKGVAWVKNLSGSGTLQDIGTLRGKIVKSQSAFSKTACALPRRAQVLDALKAGNFAQALAQYESGLSFKKKVVAKIKSLLPHPLAKYVRYLAHRKQGY